MKEMGRQFVLGETIDAALKRARGVEAKGYTYSYDMLGEAARTEADARFAITWPMPTPSAASGEHAASSDIRANPGISVKLSALHPRYEFGQARRVMADWSRASPR